MSARVPYDEFAYFADNAAEFGLPYDGPPAVRRESVALADGRRLSALVWGRGSPELVLIHGGAQNAHTWDTVAMALDKPLVALDLPGHGHSDAPRPAGSRREQVDALAGDVAEAIEALAPSAAAVVGMSLGGLTSIALTAAAPHLVRRLVLVDITPGVTAEKAKAITDFVRGPATFASFDDILARTAEHNPTRSESSLRRGILHNALQQDDGSWVWRYRRHDGATTIEDAEPSAEEVAAANAHAWDVLGAVTVPVMLVRGMRPQSVVDDEDEAELRRRLPAARVEHVEDAGHSVQGDDPVTLARLIADFAA